MPADEWMERAVLPLLLASRASAGDNEVERLDRIRMQKGVFLLTKRGSERWRGLYTFRPHHWGPYCSILVNDLRTLIQDERLANDAASVVGAYGDYRTTLYGEKLIEAHEISDTEHAFIKKTREYILSQSFGNLLRGIYRAYPNYAANSIFAQ